MEKKFSVKELVEIVNELSNLDQFVVFDILKGEVDEHTQRTLERYDISESSRPELIIAIANWNLNYPAHKDDAILALLEELLEDVKCQQQPGNQVEAEVQS